MPDATPLDVCILWHMHQPLYVEPASGRPVMPWVRLHALKDYYDMVALVREHPGVAVTFNLVPSLIEQIELAAEGSKPDSWLEVARKRPEDLTEDDHSFLLDSFFAVHHERIFPILPRLGELHAKARSASAPSWTAGDWRDLQTTFHLAWCGNTLRADPLVRRLRAKGRAFTEEEKQSLLDLQHQFLSRVLPAYREARDAGQIELTTSPQTHPILPLLCDLSSAREATPGVALPACEQKARDEAREQIRCGLEAFERRFGAKPTGVWPSEGALSDNVLDLFEEAGVVWTATDEDILFSSLRIMGHPPAPSLLTPWRCGGRKLSIFFRDRILSDLIGFTYSSWNASSASRDFLERLRGLAARRGPGMRGAVSVILDGENAWESYPRNGADFLEAIYGALQDADDLRPVTFSRHLSEITGHGELERITAGSWIRGDLLTWVGHPEKNRAWEMLADARRVFNESARPEEGLRWLRAAEGSDWFWWFGDDHSSAFDGTFDLLFRTYLKRVHAACDREPPDELGSPIKRRSGRRRVLEPTGPVTPILDGRVTDYFEWLAAGSVAATSASEVLHASTERVRALHYGADQKALALRIDPIQVPFAESVPARSLALILTSPRPARLTVSLSNEPPSEQRAAGVEFACGRILEARVALETIGLAPGEKAEFIVILADANSDPIATFPPEGTLTINVPRGEILADDWSA